MANEYVTATQLKVPLNITDTVDDTWLGIVATAASRAIDSWCNRRFYADSVASARVFYPSSSAHVWIDDALEISTVKTDTADDASFAQTWTTADYITLPTNGVGPNAQTGWPVNCLRAVKNLSFWTCSNRPFVQVTAKWGWTAVPADVTQAVYIIGEQLFRAKDAPLGVAGVSDLGTTMVKESKPAQTLLHPYRRHQGGLVH